MTRPRLRSGVLALLLAGVALPAGAAERVRLTLDPARTTITFQLPAFLHTVHGTFPLKRGALALDPDSGNCGGEIVVDVAGGQTGNVSRDRRMHQEVLESALFPEAILIPERVSGPVSSSGNSVAELAGRLRLHGVEHALTLKIEVQAAGDEARVTCRFPIPYVTWGLKNPSTTLLHVADRVDVEIHAFGRIEHEH